MKKHLQKEIWFFNHFEHWTQSFCVFVEAFWRRCENCTSLVHRNTLMKKEFFSKKMENFSKTLQTFSNFFWRSVLTFSARCQIWIRCVHKEIIEEEKFFWKNIGKLTFSNLERNTFHAFYRKKIVRVVKPELTYPWDSFEEMKNSKNVF